MTIVKGVSALAAAIAVCCAAEVDNIIIAVAGIAVLALIALKS